jgi:hypothetical protein
MGLKYIWYGHVIQTPFHGVETASTWQLFKYSGLPSAIACASSSIMRVGKTCLIKVCIYSRSKVLGDFSSKFLKFSHRPVYTNSNTALQ